MKILFLGDIMGKAGRKKVIELVPMLKKSLSLDLVIVNAENAAHGFGVTPRIANALFDAKVDIITTGDHIWDRDEIKDFIVSDKRIIRPYNYHKEKYGKGYSILEAPKGKIMVINMLGELFMNYSKKSSITSPFIAIEEILKEHKLKESVDYIFIDFHAEATSEKMAFAHYIDGKVSAVIGSHTHIPTADDQILVGGTAFQADAGMCGDYDSSIGMLKEGSINMFLKKSTRLEPAANDIDLCGTIVELNEKTGLANSIEPLRVGKRLKQTHNIG